MNIYEFFRLLVQSSADMPNKDRAFELIDKLEAGNAFGSMGLEQSDGKGHDHVKETALYMDGIRYVDRCALCKKELGPAYFREEKRSRW